MNSTRHRADNPDNPDKSTPSRLAKVPPGHPTPYTTKNDENVKKNENDGKSTKAPQHPNASRVSHVSRYPIDLARPAQSRLARWHTTGHRGTAQTLFSYSLILVFSDSRILVFYLGTESARERAHHRAQGPPYSHILTFSN